MATARYIVDSALRKLGVIGSGREPRLSDQTDALATLQGLYGTWIAAGAFGRLWDIVPTGSYYVAQGGQHIIRESADTITVILPELVSEEFHSDYGHEPVRYYGTTVAITTVGTNTTVDVQPSQPVECAVPPKDGAVVRITDRAGGMTRTWIYDGSVKAWQAIETLQLDNEAPRSFADAQGLAACLAVEVSDQFGIDPPAATVMAATRFKIAMTHRYGMRREVTYSPEAYC